MILLESILINSTFNTVFVLSYYDGIKEEVDIENSTVCLWYEYALDIDGEYWLRIKANTKEILFDYLKNLIGIRDLINNSEVTLCERLYEKYFELKIVDMLELVYPENVRLGYNFLNKLERCFNVFTK